jgi:flagellar biosynthetic protein FlhB
MADSDADRTLEATPRRLEQARERGDVPISREGSSAGVYLAALIGILLTAGLTARQVGEIVLPLIDQPDALLNYTPEGLKYAGQAVARGLAFAILPFFGLLIAGAMIPHLLGGSVTVSTQRFQMKPSHLSPMNGLKRMFSTRALFEFAKSLIKAVAVCYISFVIVRPIYENSFSLVFSDIDVLPRMLQDAVVTLLVTATLIAVLVAAVDVPYQHITYHRRMRMSLQEVRDEFRSTEGDPLFKNKLKKIRRQRARRRMMQNVPKATVVIVNPTHFAVALKYQRGKDAAPAVIAKGTDVIALRIRQTAQAHDVPVVENAPLARALHETVELGDTIPHEHFEAVAKIIGLVWAQRTRAAGQTVG